MDAMPITRLMPRHADRRVAWSTLPGAVNRMARIPLDGASMIPERTCDPAAERRTQVEDELRVRLIAGMAGDGVAYRGFLDRLAPYLRAYLRRRLPRALEDVEDILQDTLLAVHNARHTYRAGEPVTAWIHAIARYKLVDFFRAHARREALHDPIADDDLFVASDDEPADARRDVGHLLQMLPDRHRLPIQLVKLQGLTVAEAAARSGLSESAIKVGIHRGLKALAARIRGDA
ncbi:sigma-70 family RNA polymerase sigma factor [Luteibacter sp. 329MFSha]|uniref:sigma-70 family RNA polymerase sigma factor n=1 Tax=Luteibacter sp. 329MFSha TaxID=1798239 RepID=UPI001C3170C0|nr:sigma-70 family RNA polymerase sigma factor [Luteibacter sp. 329MFSha]